MSYPEHEKLKAIQPESQAQGNLISWLGEQGILLCRYDEAGNRPWPIRESVSDLLAKYHGIDQTKLEAEKRSMIDAIRTRTPNKKTK